MAVPAPGRPHDKRDCDCYQQADVDQRDELVIAISLGLRGGRLRTSTAEMGCEGNKQQYERQLSAECDQWQRGPPMGQPMHGVVIRCEAVTAVFFAATSVKWPETTARQAQPRSSGWAEPGAWLGLGLGDLAVGTAAR